MTSFAISCTNSNAYEELMSHAQKKSAHPRSARTCYVHNKEVKTIDRTNIIVTKQNVPASRQAI